MSNPEIKSLADHLWDLFTKPSAAISAVEERRKLRTLSAMVLILFPIFLINTLVTLSAGAVWTALVIGCVLLVPFYLLTRTPYYMIGAFGAIIIGIVAPLATVILNIGQAATSFAYMTDMPIISVIITTFLFRLRIMVWQVIIGIVALLLLIPVSLRGRDDVALRVLLVIDLGVWVSLLMLLIQVLRRYDLRDREQALEAVRESEHRYRAIVDSQTELICRWLPDTTLTFVNDTYCRYHERSPEELIGRRVLDILPPDESAAVARHLEKNLATMREKGMISHETQFLSRSGREYWMLWIDSPIYDEKGRIIEYQSVGRDVTDRHQALEKLRVSEERYRAVIDMQGEMICRWLPDTTLTFANETYVRFHETTREALIGTKILDRIQEPEREMVRQKVARMLETGETQTYENRWVSPSGREYWMQWNDRAIFDENGRIIEFQTVGRDVTERKRADDALRAERERYETLVNTVNGIVWEMNAFTLKTHFISRATETLFGYPPEAYMEDPLFWRSHIHPDDRESVTRFADEKFRKGENYDCEYRMQRRDGTYIWIKDLVSLSDDAQGQRFARGISIDLTAEKTAQAAEIEQRRLAEALRDTSAAILATLDLDEVLDRILDRMPNVIPIRAADILLIEGDFGRIARHRGYPLSDHETLGSIRVPVRKLTSFSTMLQTGKPYVVHETRDNPEWIEFNVSQWVRAYMGAPIIVDGETIGFVNVSSDVPDSFDETDASRLAAFADQVAIAIRNARLYEKVRQYASKLETLVEDRTAELGFERERLEVIVNGTGEGIMYTEDGVIRFANDALSQLTGYPLDELIGQRASILFGSDGNAEKDLLTETLLGRYLGRDIWRDELRLIRKDGTPFDAGVTVSLVGLPEESGVRTVSILRDISREKALQLQKSNFVAHASHELRTPLTNLKTRLYLMKRTPERLQEHLEIMESVTDRMTQLVEDLLDMTRFERGMAPLVRKPTDLCELVTGIARLQAQEAERKGLTLNQSVPDAPVMADLDAARISQIVTNLVTNAINYTPAGGQVTISLERDDDDGVAVIRVSDTGIGIAPEDLPHIFQPFYRVVSEVEGTGLGLSIAREIAESHGGSIEVESHIGKGSCFSLILPISVSFVTPSTSGN